MVQDIITFNMISINEDEAACNATMGGKKVLVDPYVGCVWGSTHFEKGEATFDGHWWKSEVDGKEVFLPRRQIFDDNLCVKCKGDLSNG